MATKSKAKQRAKAKAAYDAFLAECPSRQLLDRISDKWVALVLAGRERYDARVAKAGAGR